MFLLFNLSIIYGCLFFFAICVTVNASTAIYTTRSLEHKESQPAKVEKYPTIIKFLL